MTSTSFFDCATHGPHPRFLRASIPRLRWLFCVLDGLTSPVLCSGRDWELPGGRTREALNPTRPGTALLRPQPPLYAPISFLLALFFPAFVQSYPSPSSDRPSFQAPTFLPMSPCCPRRTHHLPSLPPGIPRAPLAPRPRVVCSLSSSLHPTSRAQSLRPFTSLLDRPASSQAVLLPGSHPSPRKPCPQT